MVKEEILHKWLNGEASAAEVELLKSDPEIAEYMAIAEATSGFDSPLFDSEMNFTSINQSIEDTNIKPGETKVRKIKTFGSLLKIAAAIVLIFAGYTFFNSLDTNISTDIAEQKSFNLPDNSEVMLNASSSISYNDNDWGENRDVQLDGEAYFKVTKGSTFTVTTKSGNVQVLGTQFNVYKRENIFAINCFEGLVQVTFNDSTTILAAGKKLKIENGEVLFFGDSNDIEPDWIREESSFENVALQEVLKEIELHYPVKITSQLKENNKRFTGSFTHKNLNLALKSVCEPLQLTYTIKEEGVTIYAKNNE